MQLTEVKNQLREDIREIVCDWSIDLDSTIEELVDLIHEYVVDEYGPPF